MQSIRICRSCDLKRKTRLLTQIAGRAYCEGGILPSRCQRCCPYKDTGCYCDKACMNSTGSCSRYCPKMNNIGRTFCSDLGWGWATIPERAFIPCRCASCCRGCENVRCPVSWFNEHSCSCLKMVDIWWDAWSLTIWAHKSPAIDSHLRTMNIE